jgi:hypothetical protein
MIMISQNNSINALGLPEALTVKLHRWMADANSIRHLNGQGVTTLQEAGFTADEVQAVHRALVRHGFVGLTGIN